MSNRKKHHPQDNDYSDVETLSDTLEKNQLINFLSQNGRVTLYFVAAIFLLIFVGQRLSTNKKFQTQKSFLEAEVLISKLNSEDYQYDLEEGETEGELIASLNDILDHHPELHAKYDGKLAQTLIKLDKGQEAVPYAEESFDRTFGDVDALQPYRTFSTITLLIEQEQFEGALQKSKQLKQSISQSDDRDHYKMLEAFNLLRIAALHQQLDQKEEEKVAWSDFINLAKQNDTKTYLALLNHFHDGKISLTDYIDARKRLIALK